MSQRLVTTTLAAALAGGGTLVVSYPAGTGKGNYSGALGHRVMTQQGSPFNAPTDFTVTFQATTFTLNWTAGTSTIPAGTTIVIQLKEPGYNNDRSKFPTPFRDGFTRAGIYIAQMSMGSASATAVCAAQAMVGVNTAAVINGGLATSGVYTSDSNFGRTLQYVSSGAGDTTQTLTVIGKDIYGVTMTEQMALNGTTIVHGKKAFATVTSITCSATLAGNLSVGNDVAFGLPMWLKDHGNVISEVVDGTTVTNGTFVGGTTAKVSIATGSADVRGTYTPSTASDGSHEYELILALEDPDYMGLPQL